MAVPTKLISTSIGFQDPKGTVVANGMLMLTLSQTATVTASGGQVTTEPIYLNLDASGKITSTAIWFSDELSPSGTIYYGTVYASNKMRMIPGLDKLQYSITGASFDLATAVQSASASPSYSGAVLLNPGGGTQTISTGNLAITNNGTVGGTLGVTGATTLSSTLGVTGTSTLAAVIGTTATLSGAVTTKSTVTLQTAGGTLPATIANDTAGGIVFTNNAGGSMQLGNGGTLFLNNSQGIRFTGATSGNTVLQAAAIAGAGVLTLPATVTDTLVGKNTTDLLTGKSFGTGIAQGSGLKHQRFGSLCTTAATAGATCTTTLTWSSAFADANYSVVCTGHTQTNTAAGPSIESVTASNFVVRISAITATASTFSTVDCIAIHD